MEQYQALLHDILENGRWKGDRTGTGTKSVFARQMRFDLSDNKLPLVTTKKVNFDLIVRENIWFLSGDTNNTVLKDNGVNIWNEWANAAGDLGPIYGAQWRNWPKFETRERPIALEERVRLSDCEEAREAYHRIKQSYKHNGKGYGRWIASLKELLDQLDVPRTYEERVVSGGIDQIAMVIEQLKTNPDSRRILVNAWNINDLPDESISPQANVEEGKMALPPCHTAFQFYTDHMTVDERLASAKRRGYSVQYKEDSNTLHETLDMLRVPQRRLSCRLWQRSADTFLGVPFNIAGYALLTHMVAQVVGMEPAEFIWEGGDCHVYANHVKQALQVLERQPCPQPRVHLNPDITDIDKFTVEDVVLVDYDSHGPIRAPVAI